MLDEVNQVSPRWNGVHLFQYSTDQEDDRRYLENYISRRIRLSETSLGGLRGYKQYKNEKEVF